MVFGKIKNKVFRHGQAMFFHKYPLPYFLFLLISLTGCLFHDNRQVLLESRIHALDAHPEVLQTRHFPLQTLQVLSGQGKTLRVYIEGDGHAWASRRRPSLDPTPRNLLLIDLMRQDHFPDKAYIARPCQFVWGDNCKIPVWTSLRYSQPMVDTLNETLDQLKAKGPYNNIELIGFSGGGTLALLMAASRDDVMSIRTVAGNLDPAFVNQFHKVSPMPDSLNPIDYYNRLASIPQLHFIGGKDTIIPPAVYSHYQSSFRKQNCLSRYMKPDARHNMGWEQSWSELLEIPVKCRQ